MVAKRKSKIRSNESLTFPNVFMSEDLMKGKWQTKVFHNTHPITLELGCGRGDYTIALARLYPDQNFIGVDLKGARIWHGASTALQESLTNVAFLRILIEDILSFFHTGDIGTIWLTFSDPFPRKKQAKHRLTSPRFLQMYETLLADGGVVHFKTDDESFFRYSVATAAEEGWTVEETIDDVHAQPIIPPLLQIQTTYEKRHRAAGKKIYYARFSPPIKKEGVDHTPFSLNSTT